jgi:hypothetical protein
MLWLDIAGVPGAGKSTIVGAWWPDRCISHKGARIPPEWASFIELAEGLLAQIPDRKQREQRTKLCLRGFLRAAAAAAVRRPGVYVQTGLIQRGYSICARVKDACAVESYFSAVPVSIGVAVLLLPEKEAVKRNHERDADRSKLIKPVAAVQKEAMRVLRERGVPLLELDGLQGVKANRARISDFVRSEGYVIGTYKR